jgi:2-isopropylmalate synthase
VEAMDRALHRALEIFYPTLAEIRLTDYKVRILDEEAGTTAVTRVLITSSDGKRHWGTVGVSENIIEASWRALIESMEYKLKKTRNSSNVQKNYHFRHDPEGRRAVSGRINDR